MWATQSDDVMIHETQLRIFFDGIGPAPGTRPVTTLEAFWMFHEHAVLCFESIKANNTVRSAAPKKLLKTDVLIQNTIKEPHES